MSRAAFPLSEEVMTHHIERHVCSGPLLPGPIEYVCPCGDTMLLCCPDCGTVILVFARPGTWCRLAERYGGKPR